MIDTLRNIFAVIGLCSVATSVALVIIAWKPEAEHNASDYYY